jgi:hypothetical protein
MQRIVQGRRYGMIFFIKVAGKKTQRLAGFPRPAW